MTYRSQRRDLLVVSASNIANNDTISMMLDKFTKPLRDIIYRMAKKTIKKEEKVEVVVKGFDPTLPANKQREFR